MAVAEASGKGVSWVVELAGEGTAVAEVEVIASWWGRYLIVMVVMGKVLERKPEGSKVLVKTCEL